MLNLFNHFKEIFFVNLQKLATENNAIITKDDFFNFIVEPGKEKLHGDLSCNIAMTLSKKFIAVEALNNPRKLAAALIEKIESESILKLEVAGAGFINIFLHPQIFYKILGDLLQAGKFEFPNLGHGEKVNLEYASPNPTGPIHVGHTRGAIYGDVLASLMSKVGYDVLKEYYVNDAGSQIDKLVQSAFLRYLEKNEVIRIDSNLVVRTGFGQEDYRYLNGTIYPEEYEEYLKENGDICHYPGEYLIEIGKKLSDEFSETVIKKIIKEKKITKEIRDFVVNEMLQLIIKDLATLGIHHDSVFSEKKQLHDTNKINEIIEFLKTKKDPNGKAIIYEGKLEAPKTEKGVGALPEGYSQEDQTLFRSNSYGDDQDRVVKKSDGAPTYFAADLAYIKSKFERGATKFIMPLGFDHAGYVKRLTAATKIITDDKAKLKVILCQMVKFIKNGEPLKMSKRAGNFITAREVIDEVGADALRFIMLTRKNDTPFDFDLAKVIEQSKDNPIFYVQYAHARCCSVLRNLDSTGLLPNIKNQEINIDVLQNLQDESEIEIIRKIATFPRIIEMAVTNYEPHRIALYLQELAALFHALWNKGIDNPNLKFIISDKLDLTKSRIYLIMALQIIISSGLSIFNINAVEKMR